MSLPPRAHLDGDWPAEIGRTAEEEMKVTATFYNSAKAEQLETKARLQHLRAPLDASTATAWATKRAIRLQVPLTATTGRIEKGWIVQIGPGVDKKGNAIPLRDPTLGTISLIVQSAVNSSHAALRTVECVSELADTPRAA